MVDLVDFNQYCWRQDMRQYHSSNSAQPIWSKDKIIWNFNSNGIYMLKSGYHNGMDIIKFTPSSTSPSKPHHDTWLWNYIYQIPMQSKIKMFLLRATQNILPTGKNLMRRGLYDSIDCIHCGLQFEDNRHAFFDYAFAKSVWEHLPLG